MFEVALGIVFAIMLLGFVSIACAILYFIAELGNDK